jgi:hypothetical protein
MLNASQDKRVKNKYKFTSCKNNPVKKLTGNQNFIILGSVLVCFTLQAPTIKKFSTNVVAAMSRFSCIENSTVLITLKYWKFNLLNI